jgi:hypothetical protein
LNENAGIGRARHDALVFVPGLQLSRAFYTEAVSPLLADVPHSAARIGSGSDVLGFDTPRSADHEWGPSLEVFLSPADAGRIPELDRRLARRLPRTFHGWPTHFEIIEGDHVGRMTPTDGPSARSLPCVGCRGHRIVGHSVASMIR